VICAGFELYKRKNSQNHKGCSQKNLASTFYAYTCEYYLHFIRILPIPTSEDPYIHILPQVGVYCICILTRKASYSTSFT